MRRQMRLDPDRPHSRPATAMRDGKGFVQVEVADVTADLAGFCQPDHRVHIGAVDIDLPAILVRDLANLPHRFLENAVGGGVGDHAGGKVFARLCRPRAEIIQIDIAIFQRLDHDNLHPRHLRRGRVGAMRGNRNQTDAPMPLALRAVIGLNGQQARIFALRARVWLHREGVIAGNLAQLRRQILDHLGIARRLITGHEGVHGGKLGPGDRHPLCRRVQFHRARSKRDHRPVEREVAVRQAAHVAHHFGFRAVHVKNRVGQVFAFAQHRLGEAKAGAVGRHAVDAKGAQDADQHLFVRGLVQTDADAIRTDLAEVQPLLPRRRQNTGLAHANLYRDRIKKRLGRDLGPCRLQRARQTVGQEMHPLCNRTQAERTVKNRVE
ncbi:hypothetical protein GALL_500010 [mine drainage metagenome]|uniref:Uncharacterized protein n=1 Tax=mine drainage metagenome TaxID=410659 RepID=A0A1J5PKT5_9ZZZZ